MEFLSFLLVSLITTSTEYQIAEKQDIPKVKCVYKVKLEKEYSLDQLELAGAKIKESCKEAPNVFIFYFLPNQSLNSSAWAYTHFNPRLDAKILGMTQSQKKKIKDPQGPILGKWIDHGPFGAKYVLQNKNGQFQMVVSHSDGSSSTDILIESGSGSNKKYLIKGSRYGEYYKIRGNHLGIYDNSGEEAITADKE